MVPAGNVTVEIQKRGFENQKEKISLRKGEPVQFAYILFPKTRGRTIIKSIYYPGSGQRYAEHKGKGNLITLAQLATIAGVVETTLLSMEAQQDYDAKDVYHNSASTDEFDQTSFEQWQRRRCSRYYYSSVNRQRNLSVAIPVTWAVLPFS